MEDEKKKKKNKKKKNKQTKTASGDVSHNVGESATVDQNHVIEQNHHNHVSETTTVQSNVPKTDLDLDRDRANGTQQGISVLAEAEKLYWIDREASLEGTIKTLQKENYTQLHKEVSLEETIKKIQKENDIHIQKETSLEETIKKLQRENDTNMQKEASMELELLQLQREKDFWLQKEASFEEKIDKLIDETASLKLKGTSLEEKIKLMERERDSWVFKENSMGETITSLNGDYTRLQAQVMELEESRNYLLQENQRLTESMSDLQSQIQNLENSIASAHTSTVMAMHVSGSEDMNAQMEPLHQLVEKLVAENTELVQKVNELHVELDSQGVTADVPPAVGSTGSKLTTGTAETTGVADTLSEFRETSPTSGGKMDSSKDVLVRGERNGGDGVNVEDTAHVADFISELSERNGGDGVNANDSAHVADFISELSERNGGDGVNANDTAHVADFISELSERNGGDGERAVLSGTRMESLEDVAVKAKGENGGYIYTNDITVIPNSPDTIDSEEIVQIPLDENEVVDPGLQTTYDDQRTDVPITDAPLIGAPFRLISFVARYVSGADLVNKN